MMAIKSGTAGLKQNGRTPQSFDELARDMEKFEVDELIASRARAWKLSWVCAVVAAASFVSLVVSLALREEPIPVVMERDPRTGAITVARPLKDAQDKYDEVTDKYWISRYVMEREGYDWFTISTQLATVKLMSEDDVAKEFEAKVRAPDAPLAMLKDKAKVVPRIISVTFIGELAQVRFSRQRVTTSGTNPDNAPEQVSVATIAYHFKAGRMTDQQRLANPLGFKALSYRADQEAIK